MKSKHLAKADFLRELAKYAGELYELGDFTCKDAEREKLSSKIEGYAAAGKTIGVVNSSDIQRVIDKAHLEKFGEEREARKARRRLFFLRREFFSPRYRGLSRIDIN